MQTNLIKKFYKSSIVNNLLPVNFKEKDSKIFKNGTTIKLPKSGLYLFKNVYLIDLGIIYKNLKALKEYIICYHIDFNVNANEFEENVKLMLIKK
jgi:hypothetical protein